MQFELASIFFFVAVGPEAVAYEQDRTLLPHDRLHPLRGAAGHIAKFPAASR